MEELIKRIDKLEKEIIEIKKRNQKVEADKTWEVSIFRKISIIIITYIFMIIVMYFLGIQNIFINAIIPTLGYFLSTLGIKILKDIYIREK